MWQIIKNEWVSWFRNRTFIGISIGFVILLLITIVLGNVQTQEQIQRYQSAHQHMRSQWENNEEMHPHGAAHYGTYVFKPANILSSLDEGVNTITGNVLRVEGHVQNEIVYSEASQMQAISKFGKLKSSLLLQYIVPLLLIFLAYQTINSEKQSGRLKLLLLQETNLTKIIIAKTLSVSVYGTGLLMLTIVAYATINAQTLNTEIVTRTILLFLSYSLYYFILTGLTIFLSTWWRNTNVALTTMLGVWILWTVFLPNILMSSVEQWHPLPYRKDFKAVMKEDRSKGIDGHNPSDQRRKELEKEILAKYQVDSLSQLPIDFGGIVMQADEEYGNLVWDKHFGNLQEILTQQKQTYQLGGILNPFISLQSLSMGFAGSDNVHHQEFLLQVEAYRRVFIKTLNDEHAYGKKKPDDDYLKVGPDFFKSVADFDYQPVKISSVFFRYRADMILLTLWGVISISLLIFGTKKMKVQ
jgi:ABC-2 type transport system permease protein